MLLECAGLTMRFGGLTAVDAVDLKLEKGQIMGLIGPNGSGKTTFFNMVSGIYKPTAGEVRLSGRNIAGRRPDYVASCGIARTFQNIRLFSGMTVWENVMIGRHCRMRQSILDDILGTARKQAEEKAAQEYLTGLLTLFKMQHMLHEQAKNLPYGKQRELEIIRAMASEPELLLLDEPAAGMNPQETAELIEFIRKLRDMGVTILVVEHDMKLVMNTCDRIAVLNNGRKIAEGSPREIQTNEAVIKAYLGKKVKEGA
ncbi:MAG: ABC transporter ATP-binding protein [Negativicutes bacterium]|nr:ABC transporter ATP-binding protein [Negativicutes bacterium]